MVTIFFWQIFFQRWFPYFGPRMSSLFTASAATAPAASSNKRGGKALSNFGVNYGKRHSQAAAMEVRRTSWLSMIPSVTILRNTPNDI